MKKYLIQKMFISYDTFEVEANSYDEAVQKFLDGEYQDVGPDGILECYKENGTYFDALRELGVSEKTIDRIIVEYNDENDTQHVIFQGILSIDED